MIGKHAARRGVARWTVLTFLLLGLPALVVAGIVLVRSDGWSALSSGDPACDRKLKVVTASSFAPVLAALAPELGKADKCVRMDIVVADGRAAPDTVRQTGADLWIPDDTSWVGTAPDLDLARLGPENTVGAGGAGTVVADSPIYMVTDAATAAKLRSAGDSWLALANLLDTDPDVKLAVREPGTSGDGMVGAGSMAETVWEGQGMDASAQVLSRAYLKTRTVRGGGVALPQQPGEVGLVAEYALVPQLGKLNRDRAVLAGKDWRVALRYTWFPTKTALADEDRAAALGRLLDALESSDGVAAISGAGLRTPQSAEPDEPPPGAGQLPSLASRQMPFLGAHHVDHVLATWYAEDRQTDLLVVVDVSGSMNDPAPGSGQSLIQLVAQGCQELENLLPDDSRLGLWEFGTQLDPPHDYRELLPASSLTESHRKATVEACRGLKTHSNGTGLYETILAAYKSAQDDARKDVPNRVLIFTDGRNQDADSKLTLSALTADLRAAADDERPVSLSVVVFGDAAATKESSAALEKALEPAQGYVDTLATAKEVSAVFIHVAAGGLHG
ncbi:von Willebrand factor type A domain-containing protein [Asanoa hainanensis]|uniref:von Willebrand factor type A domain-containing protein n=1 Tax=Asanoa hainanensis TaxID=560556 RepID=A0A239IA89_9ACTN|nr:VWA domain-containing protein [Asanoa hainanensis]SNS90228.1 von Willebrand factor type A domain-containing protein [Asanoa hainanensis]